MLEGVKADLDERVKTEKGKDAVNKLATLIANSGIDIDDIGNINKVNAWQGMYKDAEGEAQIVDMVGISLSPTWAEGPAWPVVQPAQPTVIKAPARKKRSANLLQTWKTAVFLPDPQIGFRAFDTGLDPFHDDSAMNLAVEVISAFDDEDGVHHVVNLGDFLDLAAQGKFLQEPSFAFTTQASLDRGHEWLAQQRAAAPHAKMVLIEGNHERRMQNFVTVNAAAAFGLRKANIPASWPVMSIPYLLRLDELDVDYIDAYPAGQYWVNDKLRAIHGQAVRSNGSTASKYVKDQPGVSTVFGHCHRIEVHYQTRGERYGPVRTFAASPGCLARVDGAVPSYGSGTGIDGRPETHYEDWQQGIGWAQYTDDGKVYYSSAQIIDGATVIQGQEFGVSS